MALSIFSTFAFGSNRNEVSPHSLGWLPTGPSHVCRVGLPSVIHGSCCCLRWCSLGATGTGAGSSQRRALSRRVSTPALFRHGRCASEAPAPVPCYYLNNPVPLLVDL